ncbi:hypothetical protein O181_038582 [Austropuccinia psidii MF-1]|uniref:Uncharacterized protein n=1 Tax=Austropuccinia psidii MF-1 TaxID=1389203 RepID=A0A9Q3HC17_9BASI|nr:hypothetical protein [Austropuccinia psidii MF-1]
MVELCTCSRCLTYTSHQQNGLVQGRLLSKRNIRKHHLEDSHYMIRETNSSANSSASSDSEHSNTLLSESIYDGSISGAEVSLPVLVGIFICWLHLLCALSWRNCQMVYKFVLAIIQLSRNYSVPYKSTKDLRTMLKTLQIYPKMKAYVCCTKCYLLYEGTQIPMCCMYQQLGSTICNTDLFKPTTTFNAIHDHGVGQCQKSNRAMNELTIINNPKCLYYIHEIASWIQWFLSLESIEVAIENWKEELKGATSTSDVQQSPAWTYFTWADVNPNNHAPLQLAFSLFTDWLNPHGNKLAGKQESLGCIALTCLNLPPAIHNKPSYSLLYAIVPGPSAPDVVAIFNVMKPLVDELMVLKDGIQVKTYQHPQGQMVYAQLLPLVGDLVAVHKVVGFGSHLAKQFCGWCMANSKYLQSMKVGERCTGVEILTAACAWKDAKTLKSQEEIQMKTGI